MSDPRDIAIAAQREANAAVAAKLWRDIEALAEGLRRAQPGLTEAGAITKVMDTAEGRELYERHQQAFRRAGSTYV